jgi:2'-5' RNA ligase
LNGGTDQPKPIRAFLALELPEPLRVDLGHLIETLRPQVPGLRWVDPTGIHLTLRFLGWAAPGRLARMEAPVRTAAEACPRVKVAVGGLGVFPERGSPRVFWVGIEVPQPLRRLQSACEAAAVAEGFEAETRPFHPHLTLGRWKDRARRPALPLVSLGTWPLDRLGLYQSRPGPRGSVYTPLNVFPLGA